MKKNNILSKLSTISIIVSLLASCTLDTVEDSVSAIKMTLDRHDAVMMVGDTLRLNLQFEPEDVTAPVAFWYTLSNKVSVDDRTGCIVARQTGDAVVHAITVNRTHADSCKVLVMPIWEKTFDPSDYEYDMMVYADITVNGHHNDPNIHVGAFIGDELRGVGKVREHNGITYTEFRIWHHVPNRGLFIFKYYDPERCMMGELDYDVTFDGETHGTLDELIPMSEF